MPKLLTWNEAEKIAARMCDEYGFPAPTFTSSLATYGNYEDITIIVHRISQKKNWFGRAILDEEFRVNTYGLEDALTRLQKELTSKYAARAQIAEQHRAKYAMEEADDFFDDELRK